MRESTTGTDPAADPIASSVILVPLGEMDQFSAERLVDAAAVRIDEIGEPVRLVIDLSALSFCDSSVGHVLDWAAAMPEHVDVAVVSGDVSDRVIELFPHDQRRRVGFAVR